MDAEHRIADLEAQVAAKDKQLAAKDKQLADLADRIMELEKKLATLTGELGRNASNSNSPPSSDSPADRAKRSQKRRTAKKSKRKRGGQRGHRGTRRELLPPDQVDDIVHSFPLHCDECAAALPQTPEPRPIRFQLTELPAFEPHTTEYRRHTVKCPCCRHLTTAPHDMARIPSSPFGPRLMSVIGLLTGVYHLSRRKAVNLLADMVGVKISLGALSAVEKRVSDAVAKPVQEAWKRVVKGKVKHTDGTTWYQAGVTLSQWVIATAFATVYKILANGRKDTLTPLFGNDQSGVLVGDRATSLTFWAMERRQICWAHLLRKFVSYSERDGPGGKFLERAAASGVDHVAGSCADILKHREALWTFVDERDVEPTNNHAERELRAFVLWRKRSYGSQSERGNQFAERLMTVAHTARKQKKSVLEFLTECCVAHVDGGASPSLFARAA